MMSLDSASRQEYEQLLGAFYLAPIGIVHAAADGAITLVNPASARLLMQLSPDRTVANIFAALAGVLPDLHERVADFPDSRGVVVPTQRLHGTLRDDDQVDGGAPADLALSVLKPGRDALVVLIQDLTGT